MHYTNCSQQEYDVSLILVCGSFGILFSPPYRRMASFNHKEYYIMSQLRRFRVGRKDSPPAIIEATSWELDNQGQLRFVDSGGYCTIMFNTHSWESVMIVSKLVPWPVLELPCKMNPRNVKST